MAQEIHIATDGTLTVDGKVITPSAIVTATQDVDHFIKLALVKKNWSIKNLEKVIAYGAALVGSTNGFAQAGLPANLREVLIGSAAFVLGLIHISSPTPTT